MQSIIDANKKDLEKIKKENPIYDRLILTKNRIQSMAD
jgi:gamma-glutamyl phosphate reductase